MDVTIVEGVSEALRAIAATVVMPRFAALEPGDVVMKAANDPVTVADREAEVKIGRALHLLMPHARIVGEEACAADPTLLNDLGEGMVWVVDPIDGTANFAAGRAPFAMMIALLDRGELVASWILDPLTDRLAVAQRGGGAWIDGERLRCDPSLPARDQLRGIVSEAFLPADQRPTIDQLRAVAGLVEPTARCAGHEYPLVATGARHFALYWRTLVWDHAPGALLLSEAGGALTYLDGARYCPTSNRSGLLLAHNPLLSNMLLAAVSPSN